MDLDSDRLRQIVDVLRSTNDSQVALNCLKDVQKFVPNLEGELSTEQIEFARLHNAQFLDLLYDHLDCQWYNSLDYDRLLHFNAFFTNGIIHDSFLVLARRIMGTKSSKMLELGLDILSTVIQPSSLKNMFLLQCRVDKLKSILQKEATLEFWTELVNSVISLPDKLANKLQFNLRPEFLPDVYYTNIASAMKNTLLSVHEDITNGRDCSLQFLCSLLGRCCVSGHIGLVMDELIHFLCGKTRSDFVWRKISRRFFLGVEDHHLENLVIHLVQKLEWYGLMSNLLDDAVPNNSKITYLFTKKLILFKYFDNVSVLHNILGYMGSSEERKEILIKLLISVIEVWGSPGTVKHSPYNQQLYITKAILVAVGHLTEKDVVTRKQEIMLKLMSGIETRIKSPIPSIRKLGMVAAECLISRVDPSGPQLSFEGQYSCDDEASDLKKCLRPPEDPGVKDIINAIEGNSIDERIGKSTEDSTVRKEAISRNEQKMATMQLDSDDDLEPYDMSNDTVFTKHKKPVYIRDCMTGLVDDKDIDRVQVCLETVKDLIRSDSHGLHEVAEELAKILLHMDHCDTISNYVVLRHSAMVALTVKCPKQIAEYLCGQFYERNYNLRQRMDILEVLVAAAQELGEPVNTKVHVKSATIDKMSTTNILQSIIDDRLEAKTRRFSKGRKTAASVPTENRISAVAGSFFFPLIKDFDRKQNALDLLQEDYLILGKLLFSLGVILHAAINTTIVRHMGRSLVEMILALRFHAEPFVRRSVIFALSMVVITLPAEILVSDLLVELIECRHWLEDARSYCDEESQELAVKVISIMQSTLQELFVNSNN